MFNLYDCYTKRNDHHVDTHLFLDDDHLQQWFRESWFEKETRPNISEYWVYAI